MSVSSPTYPPGGPNGILRSQSFAGFSGIPERRSRCNSFLGNSSVPKKPLAKQKKMHNLGHKSGSSSKEPQPERVEEIYSALKNGLDEYLEVHQAELDKLTAQLKDMKRNSRLGVLYDLDKQIKTIERYIRRLEFHMSKVDELYEAYCIQRRLREGACKMKQAFATSPSSKAARESLSEINKSFKEYTENMCTVESEMENLLGEFYIKMKGLAGFARLCPGDQYEIFMRYGRQRWKLKGKIEVNGKQTWDGDEMFFVPLINSLISIKVTELKGIATHILVGSVTCETKDLFAAHPQAVAVDINDLGTIKLNLEVTWCPFDTEDLTPSTGNINKATALQRRVSIYSQGTPETPTFKDHSFFIKQGSGTFLAERAMNATYFKVLFRKSRTICTCPPVDSYRTDHPEARGHLSEALTEDTGVGTSVASSPLPLTTGNESLDISLVRHLQYCSDLIKQIITSSQVLFVLRDLKKKLSRQSQVIKRLSDISKENMGNTSSAVEVISGFHDMPSLLSFWTICTTPVHIYHISADKMLKKLHETFTQMVNTESPGLADTVYRTLVAHILDKTENMLSSNLSAETITVFQYYDFFSCNNITDLKSYLMHLTKEASGELQLQTSVDGDNRTNLDACTSPHSQEILMSFNPLPKNNNDVSQALHMRTSASSKSKEYRKEATETINTLVSVCQSENEVLSKVASQKLLSLGKSIVDTEAVYGDKYHLAFNLTLMFTNSYY
ncbi:hypothetical protein GDO81_011669 [Engystomops pustulosus]|uniref:Rho family-interacting cell polarization regulator 2 n=1 Tax=Engystomops pustulosus TaxID=76066 RepID=A0AAV7BFW9_ENGPU|nr:hypothetical protein GDO81_011669 [Engystomops pustulosus]